MKAFFLILSITLYWPLSAQIIFEEVAELPLSEYPLRVNESNTGFQSALTAGTLFGKTVTSPTWIERDVDVTSLYSMFYSPDGDLYARTNSAILYSQDNGETFTPIDYPVGLATYNYTHLFVLEDDVLFIADLNSGRCFYSVDNGQSWVELDQYVVSSVPDVKLVDHFIYVVDATWTGAGKVARSNVNTGETEIVSMNELPGVWEFYKAQIMEDGTVYAHARDLQGPDPGDYLIRYKFGQEIESLGTFPNLITSFSLYAAGSTLYSLQANMIRVFNGFEFQPLTYIGLPQDENNWFMLSDNDHIYVNVDNHRIFRSVGTFNQPGVISGKVSLDEDIGCIPDTAEIGLAFWNVTIEGDNFFRSGISGPNGEFRYPVPEGEYTVSAQEPGLAWELCENVIHVAVDENQPTATVDFLSHATGACANLSMDFSTPFLRRCFENYYTVRVRNTGPQASTNTMLVLHLDQFFEFHSATIPYHQIDATTVSFDLGTLEFNADLTFRIYFTLSCDAELGMEHCLSGNVTCDNVCIEEGTIASECQSNFGSLDPNDKRAFNAQGRESDQVDKDEYITYHIRFQNTGTDTAFNVRIIDLLSSYLDLGTLEMLSASHPYSYQIMDGPSLVVDFNNILLQDSFANEPASHGFVKFRIKPLPSFDYGTTIPNKADIFFDYNEPVLTNEALTKILPAVGVHDTQELIDFTVFPNPAKDKLELRIAETYHLLIDTWIIYDSQGRIVAQGLYRQDQSLNITSLTPGAYTVMLMHDKNVIGTKAFVRG